LRAILYSRAISQPNGADVTRLQAGLPQTGLENWYEKLNYNFQKTI